MQFSNNFTNNILRLKMNKFYESQQQSSYQYRLQNARNVFLTSRPWCSSSNDSNDYCPIVIAIMSFVIIISLILILYLCSKSSFKCKSLRKLVLRLKNKLNKPNRRQRSIYNRSGSLSNMNIPFSENSTPSSDSAPGILNRFGSFLSSSSSTTNNTNDIWFTDVSKYARPPPTYEESQQVSNTISTRQAHLNRVIKTYPRKLFVSSSNVNDAFSMESVNETRIGSNLERIPSRGVFPTYRCLALTTSPSTQAHLQQLGALSRQLLDENGPADSCLNLDEVPPAYETVVSSNNNQLNRARSFMNASRANREFAI